jgi:hypothetical protein
MQNISLVREGRRLNLTVTLQQADVVVIGFASDVAFKQAQDPRLDCSVQSTNKLFATAPAALAAVLSPSAWFSAA